MTPAFEAAIAARKRIAPEPDTIRRLRTIKPGEEVIYYSGDMNELAHSQPGAYRELVERIADFARGLELAGRVELRTQKRIVQMRDRSVLTVTDYIAVGKAHRS